MSEQGMIKITDAVARYPMDRHELAKLLREGKILGQKNPGKTARWRIDPASLDAYMLGKGRTPAGNNGHGRPALGTSGWLTTKEAAALLGVGSNRVTWLHRNGRLAGTRIREGKHSFTLIEPQSVEALRQARVSTGADVRAAKRATTAARKTKVREMQQRSRRADVAGDQARAPERASGALARIEAMLTTFDVRLMRIEALLGDLDKSLQ